MKDVDSTSPEGHFNFLKHTKTPVGQELPGRVFGGNLATSLTRPHLHQAPPTAAATSAWG